jgi:RecA-family ATPase
MATHRLENYERMPAVEACTLEGVPLPNRQWLVDGWIPERAVTMLSGDGGVGKSLLVLQLMIASALNKHWLGKAVEHRRSFAMFCEDDKDEIHLRARAILDSHGASFADLKGVTWAPRAGLENVLMSFPTTGNERGTPTRAYNEFRNQVVSSGARLVIIDTVADTFGGNENFRSQVRGFIGLLRHLANEIDGSVILTAHPSVAGKENGTGISGSTAWNNSVRSRLYLTRPTTDEDAQINKDARILKNMKSNYGSIGDTVSFRWSDGAFVVDAYEDSLDRGARSSRADRVFLECLRKLVQQGETVTSKPSAIFAPKVMRSRFPECGVTKNDLEAAMNRHLNSGAIRLETDGPPSRQRTFLSVCSKD